MNEIREQNNLNHEDISFYNSLNIFTKNKL